MSEKCYLSHRIRTEADSCMEICSPSTNSSIALHCVAVFLFSRDSSFTTSGYYSTVAATGMQYNEQLNIKF